MRDAGSGPIERVSVALALAAGGVLCALAGLVAASVLLRWTTAQAIAGDFELVQTGVALVVLACLPLCQHRRRNIVIDSFTVRAPAALRRVLDATWALAYAATAALLAWQMARGAAETIASGTVSMVLALPIGWAMALAALLLGWLAVVGATTALPPGPRA